MSTTPADQSGTTAEPDTDHDPVADPDADPDMLNPRDLRGVETGDGAREEGETDADPGTLNPRGD